MYAHINYHTKLSKLIKKVDKTKNETKYLKRKKKILQNWLPDTQIRGIPLLHEALTGKKLVLLEGLSLFKIFVFQIARKE